MKKSSLRVPIAASFWPPALGSDGRARTARVSPRVAVNLYELFVHEVSVLVSGACHADRMARVLFAAISAEQIRLRQLVLGLARSSRGCLPHLPPALVEDGLVLLPVRDHVVNVLLRPAGPRRGGSVVTESAAVVGACTVRALSQVAQHFESATARAAEDARWLGSDGLHQVLTRWSEMWRGYHHDLRLREKHFRAQAYGAGLDLRPFGHSA